MKYLFLLIAIVCEVTATSAMNASQQFSKLVPSVITVLCYGMAFYFMSLTLRSMPVGTVYAIWSGAGIVLTSVAAIFLFKQIPDTPAIIGIILIIAGVLIMNLFSKTAAH